MSQQDGCDAMAAALLEQIRRVGKENDPMAMDFVTSAKNGAYASCNAIGPDYIGLTHDEFTAIRMLAYSRR